MTRDAGLGSEENAFLAYEPEVIFPIAMKRDSKGNLHPEKRGREALDDALLMWGISWDPDEIKSGQYFARLRKIESSSPPDPENRRQKIRNKDPQANLMWTITKMASQSGSLSWGYGGVIAENIKFEILNQRTGEVGIFSYKGLGMVAGGSKNFKASPRHSTIPSKGKVFTNIWLYDSKRLGRENEPFSCFRRSNEGRGIYT